MKQEGKILKTLIGIVIGLIAILLVSVYILRGTIGAWAWAIAVFITGPLACILAVVQFIRSIRKIIKKKYVGSNLLLLLMLFILAYPVTIAFGLSSITYPTSKTATPSITIEVPVKGEGITLFGGSEYKSHAIWPSECYAYDIVATPHDVGSPRLEDYGIYGREVVSPIEGEVIETHDGEEDIEPNPNADEFTSLAGNYIYIKIKDTDTYLMLGHLKKGSVAVVAGDYVEKGDLLGEVGNSGTTSEPHLHIQHQRNNPQEVPFPICAEGLPIVFVP